jgi:hypothetical protein
MRNGLLVIAALTKIDEVVLTKRSEEEKRRIGERRSNIDRRSGVDRRSPVADTKKGN